MDQVLSRDKKTSFIEQVLGFLLDEPFAETAANFPSPDDVVESWYLTATIFKNISGAHIIMGEEQEALHTLNGEAEAEYWTAKVLDEEPDTKEALGSGYDDGEIPEGFAAKLQTAIWTEVLAVHKTDKRLPELSLESDDDA